MKERYRRLGEKLRAMDTLVKAVNYEPLYYSWLAIGIADGDCDLYDDEDLGEEYFEDAKDIEELFLAIMAEANENGGLYLG